MLVVLHHEEEHRRQRGTTVKAQPEPIFSLWEWQQKGLCRQSNPEVFFHPEGERGPSRRRREARAIAICQECPVLQQCRDHALRVQEPFGIWGGMSESDRADIIAGRKARPA